MLASLVEAAGIAAVFGQQRDTATIPAGLSPWEHGYALGEAARQVLVPAPGPIRNLEKALNASGIHVARVALQARELEGASVWERGAVPVILVTSRAGRARRPSERAAAFTHLPYLRANR